MHRRFAIELRRNRLLHEILALDDTRQRRLDDLITALIGRHVGEPKLVVQFLLSHIIRADMSDHLADYGLLRLLLAASGEQHRRRQSARDRRDTPPAPRHWRYVQQSYSPELQRDDAQTRNSREIVTEGPATRRLSLGPPS